MVARLEIGQSFGGYRLLRQLAARPLPIFEAEDDGARLQLTWIARDLIDDGAALLTDLESAGRSDVISAPKLAEQDDGWLLAERIGEGKSLAETLASAGPIEPAAAIRIVRDVTRLLMPLHLAEQIHGAVWPCHVRRSSAEEVELHGFGLFLPSKLWVTERNRLFRSDDEPPADFDAFIAPEFGLVDSPASDIYSLGRLLLMLLSDDARHHVVYLPLGDRFRTDDEARRLAGFLQALPSPIRQLLKDCLSYELDKRPTAADLESRLDSLLNDRQLVKLAIPLPPAAVAPPEVAESTAWPARHPIAYGLCLMLLLPCLGLGAAWLSGWLRPVAFVGKGERELRNTQLCTATGPDGIWWTDDEATFFLLPPARAWLMQQDIDLDRARETLFGSDDRSPAEAASVGRLSDAVSTYQPCLEALWPKADLGRMRARALLDRALDAVPEPTSAAEWHLRAILLHRRASLERAALTDPFDDLPAVSSPSDYESKATDAYEQALRDYNWLDVGLRALCHSDYARWLAVLGRSTAAEEQLIRARDLIYLAHLPPGGPESGDDRLRQSAHHRRLASAAQLPEAAQSFLAAVLCQLADLYRKEGAWVAAEDALEEACAVVRLTDSSDEGELSRLQAFVLERQAWFWMDRWELNDAERNFLVARTARKRFKDGASGNLRDWQLFFHNWHGLAMIARYRGQAANARTNYEQIIKAVRDRAEGAVADERTLLDQRLANSLERLADCILFASEDWDAAADQLSESIYETDKQFQLRPTPTNSLASPYFKLALAQAMNDKFQEAQESFDRAESYAPRKAGSPLDAQAVDAAGRQQAEATYRSQRTLSTRNLVEAVIRHKQRQLTSEELYQTIRREYLRLDRSEQISRDELDLLLLTARLFRNDEDDVPWTQARLFADLNVALARLPQMSGNHASILPYVRPNYQVAINLHCAAGRDEIAARRCQFLKTEKDKGWRVP